MKKVLADENGVTGILLENDAVIVGDAVLVATGGLSYPTTGSTGDGYRFAGECGHDVTGLRAIARSHGDRGRLYCRDAGLSLRNVTLRMYTGGKCCFEDFGEDDVHAFRHYRAAGSRQQARGWETVCSRVPLACEIDWKPALSEEQLDDRLLQDFTKNQNKQFKTVAQGLGAVKAMSALLELWGSSPKRRSMRYRGGASCLCQAFKTFPFTVTGLRGYSEAVVTAGGVAVREINPKTMESKKVKGLYFD